jgi:hypothetical protein
MAVTKATIRIGMMKNFAFMLILLSIEKPGPGGDNIYMNLYFFHGPYLIPTYHIVVCQAFLKFYPMKTDNIHNFLSIFNGCCSALRIKK